MVAMHAGAPAGFKALGPVVCVEIKPKAGCLPIRWAWPKYALMT